jgi:hypothetical protein
MSEVLLLVFGAILTVGVLGEYKKFPRLLKWSLATFELLVVIGIAGELLADGAIFVFSRHLQTLSEGEYATLNNEAGIARKEAGDAKERAANLELLIAARNLTREQQNTIGESLKKFSGRKVTLVSYALDAEGFVIATQIKFALEAGRLTVEDMRGKTLPFGGVGVGINVSGPPNERPFVDALASSLEDDGKLGVVPIRPTTKRGTPVTLTVGVKPFVTLQETQLPSLPELKLGSNPNTTLTIQ